MVKRPFDLRDLEMVDDHAHSLLCEFSQASTLQFRGAFSESKQSRFLESSLPQSMNYIHMLNCLKEIYPFESEADYQLIRSKLDPKEHVLKLFGHARLSTLMIDDGFSQDSMLTIGELTDLSGLSVYRILRIESELESLIKEYDSPASILEQFGAGLTPDVVGLKTICAYRGGLAIGEVSENEAKDELDYIRWKYKGTTNQVRLDGTKAHHYFLRQIFQLAADKYLPVQIHCGIGDQDQELHKSNPTLLSDCFRVESFSGAKFVLLHCYPFVKEAAYLASIFSNVYLDLSLAPIMVPGAISSIYQEALSAAPFNKILAGSDGHSHPEAHWFGAIMSKMGLENALTYFYEQGMLKKDDVINCAKLILSENARSLYKLE